MNRRSFFKRAAIIVAGAAVAPFVKPASPVPPTPLAPLLPPMYANAWPPYWTVWTSATNTTNWHYVGNTLHGIHDVTVYPVALNTEAIESKYKLSYRVD